MIKNVLLMFLAMVFAVLLVVPAVGASTIVKEDVIVQINGVEVKGDATHWVPGKLRVDAIAYAELLGKDYTFDKEKKTFTIDEEELEVKMYNGLPSVHIRAIAEATGAENVDWDQSTPTWTAYVLDLPDGSIALEPVESVYSDGVPGMGQHWGLPDELPTGPIYGVEKGKLIFIEQMISQEDFINGESYVNIPGMKGLPSLPIEHTDIEFVPNGHPGFEVPHFDIHHYFVTHEEHLKFSLPPGETETGHSH
ncbi:hypothetical protein [Aquibacillus albus]|uniref:Copper amine oxidase-like N-terminal domain-containing protein n=1 Tax=Aquibacillus albus TaxID=1168171 RepID=A0ABS2MXC4_9BACI|nr:hypothetical protein [Aquibacillus albus]MBM7570428.1 hypothetical protein [Aquibacillus albus]